MDEESTLLGEEYSFVAEPKSRYQLKLPFGQQREQSATVQIANIEDRLRHLLKQDLTFNGEKTRYATHSLHAFAAKFPPQLPQLFIRELSNKGEVVLDPMVGSGTTVVESVLAGRLGIGIDLDPLAVLIAKAKSIPLDPIRCAEIGSYVSEQAKRNLGASRRAGFDHTYTSGAVQFFEYWFEEHTIAELSALAQAIMTVEDSRIRSFLWVVLSSIIITKSGGITRARDLAHSRPHRDPNKQVRQNSIEAFEERLYQSVELLDEIRQASGQALICRADARALPLPDDSVHLIVTSPPYAANAIDYMRAHKFSLMWLGYPPIALTNLRKNYIGSELRSSELDFSSDTANWVIHAINKKEPRRAAVVAHYFRDMERVLLELLRVLVEGRAAILIVGSSTIKGVGIRVPDVLEELADSIGFRVVEIAKRQIIRNARMMPVSHNSTQLGIEARMHEEGVIGLIKPKNGNHDANT